MCSAHMHCDLPPSSPRCVDVDVSRLSCPPFTPLQRRLQLYSASAAIPPDALTSGGAEQGRDGAKTGMEKLKGYPAAVYKFTRPHTIRGEIRCPPVGYPTRRSNFM